MRLSNTQNFIEDTKAEFQQYENEQITDKKATEIQHNMFGVMDLLVRWSKAFIEESQKILRRLQQLIGAKDRHANLDLLLHNGEHSLSYKNREQMKHFK